MSATPGKKQLKILNDPDVSWCLASARYSFKDLRHVQYVLDLHNIDGVWHFDSLAIDINMNYFSIISAQHDLRKAERADPCLVDLLAYCDV